VGTVEGFVLFPVLVKFFYGLPHVAPVFLSFSHKLQFFPVILGLTELSPWVLKKLVYALVVVLQLQQLQIVDRLTVLVFSLEFRYLGLSFLLFYLFLLPQLFFYHHQLFVGGLQLKSSAREPVLPRLDATFALCRVVFKNEVSVAVLLVEVFVGSVRVVSVVMVGDDEAIIDVGVDYFHLLIVGRWRLFLLIKHFNIVHNRGVDFFFLLIR